MASIVQPPRAFQLAIIFHFPEDTRSDAELMQYILRSVSSALEIGAYGKGAGVVRIPVPPEFHVKQ